MKIEVLFFRGCPHHQEAVDRLRAVLRQENLTAEIEEIEISDGAAGFPGSPTIRVDGRDIEPGAPSQGALGLACRTYMGAAGCEGAPPLELIRQAVRKALPNPY